MVLGLPSYSNAIRAGVRMACNFFGPVCINPNAHGGSFWKILLKFSDVMSSYDIFVNSNWKNHNFFYKFGASYLSHDNYFYGKKLYILLAPHNIYQKQKQKTKSVYLIPINNYGPFSEMT